MNKARLFDYLKHQDPETLIQLLEKCYDSMRIQQIDEVFGHLNNQLFNMPSPQDGKLLFEEVRKFRDDSLQGVYYAPFDINSKNYMNVPEETDQWFDKLGDLRVQLQKRSKSVTQRSYYDQMNLHLKTTINSKSVLHLHRYAHLPR